MTETGTFLAGVGMTLVAALLVVLYLRRPLDRLLIELCGTEERARFWSAFTSVSLVLVPLVFALDYRPDDFEKIPAVIGIATQVKWALGGLVATATLVAFTLSRFIPRGPAAATPPGRNTGAGGAV